VGDYDLSSVTSAIHSHVRAMQKEDGENLFGRIVHPESPIVKKAGEVTHLFSGYDLTYEVESVEILSRTPGTVRVRALLLTRRKSGCGLPYLDNRCPAEYELRKHQDLWRVFRFEYCTEEAEYLK
jgi:hypothetical protein